jgi:16S rRNA (cytidine1402-2'-O)-methyltransferase
VTSRSDRDPKSAARAPSGAGAQPSPEGAPSKSDDDQIEHGGTLAPGLYVVATPIGNLGDMSARAIATLQGADLIACEDTRVTGVLLRRFGITTAMTPYHDHNAERVRPGLVRRLAAGERIALVSDAGTPLLSDPGFKLVQACADANVPVIPIPGASALLAALVTAALPTDRVLFAGFLPAKSAARRSALVDVKTLRATLVFYESNQRLGESLHAMADVLGDRRATVCRELTKRHEEVRRDTLAALAAHYDAAGAPRGEIVIVVEGAPNEATTMDDAAIDEALRRALDVHSVRDAAALVAAESGQPKRDIYARALALTRKAP